MNPAKPQPQRFDFHLHLPTKTILKILLTFLLVKAGLRLWPEFIFLLISLLLAVALHPVVAALEKRGLSRGAVVALMTLLLVALMALLVVVVFTSMAEQLSKLVQDFPDLRQRVEQRLPTRYPILKQVVSEIFALPSSPEVAAKLKRPLALGTVALSGVLSMFFTIIVTIYLLLDGKRLYAWLIAYVPRAHRDRMAITAEEVSQVVYAYVRGQVLTSILFAGFSGVVLYLFHVPAAMPLALLAGLCDVIPVVGIIIATVPAVLLALTVSPAAAAIVFALYIFYHIIESYLIVPRVYGRQLRLSTLAVLLALLAGTTLQGLIGAVLVLPLVAAYPIIERVWLAKYLGWEVIKDHGALADAVESKDGEGVEEVVETVLQGEKHEGERPTDPQSRKAITETPTK
ncbi:MAG TPA: AI-2E family transporter, partial [Polyangia bacterium]|nr:AI-2E family transporter [Polyangia bacterium]